MADQKGATLARNEGRLIHGLAGNLRIKVGGTDSAGALSVVEYEIVPGGRTVAHYHLKIYESVFVSEGELRVRVGDAWTTQTAGATILLPVGVVHAWENRSPAPARMVIISHQPPSLRRTRRPPGLKNAPGGKPDLEQLRELNRRYDFVLVAD